MKAPGSIAKLSCSTSPDICAVEAKNTLFARIMPLTEPCIRTVCATISPKTEPFTPTINALQRMSPFTVPSTCTSPEEAKCPSMDKLALIIEGTDLVKSARGPGVSRGGVLLAFENIASGL